MNAFVWIGHTLEAAALLACVLVAIGTLRAIARCVRGFPSSTQSQREQALGAFGAGASLGALQWQ